MTPLYHARKSDGRWFVRAFALLMFCVPSSCTASKCICTSEC